MIIHFYLRVDLTHERFVSCLVVSSNDNAIPKRVSFRASILISFNIRRESHLYWLGNLPSVIHDAAHQVEVFSRAQLVAIVAHVVLALLIFQNF